MSLLFMFISSRSIMLIELVSELLRLLDSELSSMLLMLGSDLNDENFVSSLFIFNN